MQKPFSTTPQDPNKKSSFLNKSVEIYWKYEKRFGIDLELIFDESLLSKRLRNKNKVIKSIQAKNSLIRKNHIKKILSEISYDEIKKFSKALKKILFFMKNVKTTQEFFTLYYFEKKDLQDKIKQMKCDHPLLIKYLNFIFKNSEEWKLNFNVSEKIESLYEETYFLNVSKNGSSDNIQISNEFQKKTEELRHQFKSKLEKNKREALQ